MIVHKTDCLDERVFIQTGDRRIGNKWRIVQPVKLAVIFLSRRRTRNSCDLPRVDTAELPPEKHSVFSSAVWPCPWMKIGRTSPTLEPALEMSSR